MSAQSFRKLNFCADTLAEPRHRGYFCVLSSIALFERSFLWYVIANLWASSLILCIKNNALDSLGSIIDFELKFFMSN